tara:strand:+ start:2710 stop:6771 length:4062 start_codon:yes stop_codon:yes gene_type:complete
MAELATFKYLSDGSPIRINSSDPDVIAQKIREGELAIQQRRKQRQYLASPEYQPAEEAPEGEEITTYGKVGRGILSGLVTIPTELAATIGYGLSAAGYEQGDEIARQAMVVQDTYAPDIEGLGAWAEVPKALVQFGVPGGLVLKTLGNANKATKLLALASAEGMVAEEDMKSFGDTFLPNPITKTKELEALDGQERALAALYNKGVNGLESAAMLAGIPLTITAGGAVINTTAKGLAKVPGIKQVGKGLGVVGEGFSKTIDKIEKTSPAFRALASSVRFRGRLPDEQVAEIKALRAVEFGGLAHANLQAMNDLSSTVKQVMKEGKANGYNTEKMIDAINDYLYPTDDIATGSKVSAQAKQEEAAKLLVEMDKSFGFVKGGDRYTSFTKPENIQTQYSLFRAAKNARKTIDNYSERLTNHPEFLPEGVQDIIDGQTGLYGATQYRMFLDEEYVPTPEATEAAIQTIMKGAEQSGVSYTREEAVEALMQLKGKDGFVNKKLSPQDLLEEKVLTAIQSGPLKGKTLNSPAIKEFLGEYTGRKQIGSKIQTEAERVEGLLSKTKETIGRQSAVLAKGQYFKRLSQYNDSLPEGQKMFRDTPPPEGLVAMRDGDQYIKVPEGLGYGELRGKWVKKEYLTALEQQSSYFDARGMNAMLGYAFGTYLGAKSMVQKAVTVYNPEGQMRNVMSALGFVVGNGNVPKGKDISEAFSLIYGELGNKTTTTAARKQLIQEYVDRGVIGTQAQIGEINSLIEQAVDQTSGVTRKLFKKSADAQNNFATQLYRAGDDVWKVANFEIEKRKLRGMVQKAALKGKPIALKANTLEQANIARSAGLDPNNVDLVALSRQGKNQFDEFLAEEAAYITRNNVPNYSRVPLAVQYARQMPFGNFIAYPSELIRTSFNVIGRGITEIASDNADLRARGLQRLLGYSAIAYGIPQGLQAFGLMMTGSTRDQIEAWKRSAAYDWEKNSTFIPIRTDKDGNIREMVNSSYTMPYDYLVRPIDAVLNAYNNGVRSEQELTDIAYNAGMGVVEELASPFVGQEMLFQRIREAFANENQYGSPLTNATDDMVGDKLWAGFAHILNGLIPAFAPAELNTRGNPMDTTNYNLLRSLRLGDLSQSALVEAGVMPRDYLSRISDRGKKLDVYQEAAESLTATKVLDLGEGKLEKQLGYLAQDVKGELGRAKKIYDSLKREHGARLGEEILQRYIKSNEQQFKTLKKLSVAVDDFRELGLSEEQIAFVLRKEVGGIQGWQGIMNHVYIPKAPKPEITTELYKAETDKRRNVAPVGQMLDELGRSYKEDQFPLPKPTAQRPPALSDRLPGLIQETVESIPDTASGLYNRARQFLRSEEEKKLMGGS